MPSPGNHPATIRARDNGRRLTGTSTAAGIHSSPTPWPGGRSLAEVRHAAGSANIATASHNVNIAIYDGDEPQDMFTFGG